MSQARAERLVNLALCLMSSETRLWPADEIRRTVRGYDHPDTPEGDAAFRRAFERDKDELRGLGFPILTAPSWTGVEGYRIPRQEAFLPEIHLDGDEARLVALAVRVWRSGSLAQAAATAWTKLRAAGVAGPFADLADSPATGGPAGEPAFDPLLAALRDGRAVHFDYRSGGGPTATRRTVEPWGLRAVRNRWYLLGRDRDKDAPRVFRLSRIVGDVVPTGRAGAVRRPAERDLADHLARLVDGGAGPERTATVRLRPGRAVALRRTALAGRPVLDAAGHEVALLVDVAFRDLDRTAQTLASYGTDAVVVEPGDLREAVLARLRAASVAAAEDLDGARR